MRISFAVKNNIAISFFNVVADGMVLVGRLKIFGGGYGPGPRPSHFGPRRSLRRHEWNARPGNTQRMTSRQGVLSKASLQKLEKRMGKEIRLVIKGEMHLWSSCPKWHSVRMVASSHAYCVTLSRTSWYHIKTLILVSNLG